MGEEVRSGRGARYDRQQRFAAIGASGQHALSQSRVLVLGCGALGAASSEMLTRAGVGFLRLVDRDLVEWSNLQRQALYDEGDADGGLPKAVAACRHLRGINSEVRCDAVVADAKASTIEGLISTCDLVIDGTDNFSTRHLINEACLRMRTPWVYGACVGAYGCSVAIVPGLTPCLRCLQDQLPAPGETPTCDTVGIIAPAVHLVASWQVAEALKILIGSFSALRRELWCSDLWSGTFQRLRMDSWRDPACPVCGPHPSFPLLTRGDDTMVTLCGRDAVQVQRTPPNLEELARNLGPELVIRNEYLVRWRSQGAEATCFRDGRVIVHGVTDASAARAFCDRFLG